MGSNIVDFVDTTLIVSITFLDLEPVISPLISIAGIALFNNGIFFVFSKLTAPFPSNSTDPSFVFVIISSILLSISIDISNAFA